MTTLVLCAALSLSCIIRVPAAALLNRHRASLVMVMVRGAVSLLVAGARLAAVNLSFHPKIFIQKRLTSTAAWVNRFSKPRSSHDNLSKSGEATKR